MIPVICAYFLRLPKRMNLMYLVKSFPLLNRTVMLTCLELLLLFEITIQLQDGPQNLMSFFPNWLRSSLRKGVYKVKH